MYHYTKKNWDIFIIIILKLIIIIIKWDNYIFFYIQNFFSLYFIPWDKKKKNCTHVGDLIEVIMIFLCSHLNIIGFKAS